MGGSGGGKGKGRGGAVGGGGVRKRGRGDGGGAMVWKPKEPADASSSSAASTALPAPAPAVMLKKRLLGFDFDCTLTVRHFYKVFAWGYAQGNLSAHPHCRYFAEWCEEQKISTKMEGCVEDDMVMDALENFCQGAGEASFRDVFREVFLGGSARIEMVAAWLAKMKRQGVEFAIVTAGVSASVVRALSVVPEWQPFFSSGRIWDTQQGRHRTTLIAGQKALILRDLSPDAHRILLVDDALGKDPVPEWIEKGASVDSFPLPYEGPGVDEESLKAIEAAILR